MKWLALALVELLLAGCVGYLPIPVDDLPRGDGRWGDAELTTYLFMSGERQEDADWRALWHPALDDVLHRELERSGYFTHLHYLKGPSPPLKLHVSMQKTVKRDSVDEQGAVATAIILGIGTLPSRVDWRYDASFTFRCRTDVLVKWTYELAASELKLSSPLMPNVVGRDIDERAVLSFVPRFLRDAAARADLIGACR